MLALLNILILLALLSAGTASTSNEDPWSDPWLLDWDNGWRVNIHGEPIDPETGCFGEPCKPFKLPEPHPPYILPDLCKSATGPGMVPCFDYSKYPDRFPEQTDEEFEASKLSPLNGDDDTLDCYGTQDTI